MYKIDGRGLGGWSKNRSLGQTPSSDSDFILVEFPKSPKTMNDLKLGRKSKPNSNLEKCLLKITKYGKVNRSLWS